MGDASSTIEAITRAAMFPGSVPAAPPTPPMAAPVDVLVVSAPTPTPATPLPPLPSISLFTSAIGTGVFTAMMVFVVITIILIAVNPPFVHAPSDEPRNALEAAPCSYGRVMTAAAVFAVIAVAIPIAVKHRQRIISGSNRALAWAKSIQAQFKK